MKTKQILLVLHIIAWMLFIGTCIKTGALLTSIFVSLTIDSNATKNLYMSLDLTSLYEYSLWYYIGMLSFVFFIGVLKAYMTYQVVLIFLKLNLVNPFSTAVEKLITKISEAAVTIGIISLIADNTGDWLRKKGVDLSDLYEHYSGGAEYLFFGAIIFIIAQIFKKGIELQSENELTV